LKLYIKNKNVLFPKFPFEISNRKKITMHQLCLRYTNSRKSLILTFKNHNDFARFKIICVIIFALFIQCQVYLGDGFTEEQSVDLGFLQLGLLQKVGFQITGINTDNVGDELPTRPSPTLMARKSSCSLIMTRAHLLKNRPCPLGD
jgi:hypothetical protein